MLSTGTSNLSDNTLPPGRGDEAMLPFRSNRVARFLARVRLKYTIDDEPPVLDQQPQGLTHIAHKGYAWRAY